MSRTGSMLLPDYDTARSLLIAAIHLQPKDNTFDQSEYYPWPILECGIVPKGLFHGYDS